MEAIIPFVRALLSLTLLSAAIKTARGDDCVYSTESIALPFVFNLDIDHRSNYGFLTDVYSITHAIIRAREIGADAVTFDPNAYSAWGKRAPLIISGRSGGGLISAILTPQLVTAPAYLIEEDAFCYEYKDGPEVIPLEALFAWAKQKGAFAATRADEATSGLLNAFYALRLTSVISYPRYYGEGAMLLEQAIPMNHVSLPFEFDSNRWGDYIQLSTGYAGGRSQLFGAQCQCAAIQVCYSKGADAYTFTVARQQVQCFWGSVGGKWNSSAGVLRSGVLSPVDVDLSSCVSVLNDDVTLYGWSYDLNYCRTNRYIGVKSWWDAFWGGYVSFPLAYGGPFSFEVGANGGDAIVILSYLPRMPPYKSGQNYLECRLGSNSAAISNMTSLFSESSPQAPTNTSLPIPSSVTGVLDLARGPLPLPSPVGFTVSAVTYDRLIINCTRVNRAFVITSVYNIIYGHAQSNCYGNATIQFLYRASIISQTVGRPFAIIAVNLPNLGIRDMDPCYGLRKTLSVTAICGPKAPTPSPTRKRTTRPVTSTLTARDGQQLIINCALVDPTFIISSVYNISYGSSRANCYGTPTAQSIYRAHVVAQTVGRPSALIFVSLGTLGLADDLALDPCFGITKFLTVTVVCSSMATSPHPTSRRLNTPTLKRVTLRPSPKRSPSSRKLTGTPTKKPFTKPPTQKPSLTIHRFTRTPTRKPSLLQGSCRSTVFNGALQSLGLSGSATLANGVITLARTGDSTGSASLRLMGFQYMKASFSLFIGNCSREPGEGFVFGFGSGPLSNNDFELGIQNGLSVTMDLRSNQPGDYANTLSVFADLFPIESAFTLRGFCSNDWANIVLSVYSAVTEPDTIVATVLVDGYPVIDQSLIPGFRLDSSVALIFRAKTSTSHTATFSVRNVLVESLCAQCTSSIQCGVGTRCNAQSKTCLCASPFQGTYPLCGINRCNPNPCGPGRCFSLFNDYRCVCDNGYEFSQTLGICVNINECTRNRNLCKGGTCVDNVGAFTCRCPQGSVFDSSRSTCRVPADMSLFKIKDSILLKTTKPVATIADALGFHKAYNSGSNRNHIGENFNQLRSQYGGTDGWSAKGSGGAIDQSERLSATYSDWRVDPSMTTMTFGTPRVLEIPEQVIYGTVDNSDSDTLLSTTQQVGYSYTKKIVNEYWDSTSTFQGHDYTYDTQLTVQHSVDASVGAKFGWFSASVGYSFSNTQQYSTHEQMSFKLSTFSQTHRQEVDTTTLSSQISVSATVPPHSKKHFEIVVKKVRLSIDWVATQTMDCAVTLNGVLRSANGAQNLRNFHQSYVGTNAQPSLAYTFDPIRTKIAYEASNALPPWQWNELCKCYPHLNRSTVIGERGGRRCG